MVDPVAIERCKVITPPMGEPVSVPELRAHLRIDHGDEDALLAVYAAAACMDIEETCNRALVSRTLETTLDRWPSGNAIALPRPPLVSVTSVTITNELGVSRVWSSADYLVDKDSEPGRIVLKTGVSWPSDTLAPVNGIRIRWVAGYGDADDVPALLAMGLRLLAGEYFENRESLVVGAGVVASELPAVKRIVRLFKLEY